MTALLSVLSLCDVFLLSSVCFNLPTLNFGGDKIIKLLVTWVSQTVCLFLQKVALHHHFQHVWFQYKKRLSQSCVCVVVVGFDPFIPSSPRCRNIQTPIGASTRDTSTLLPLSLDCFHLKESHDEESLAVFFFPPHTIKQTATGSQRAVHYSQPKSFTPLGEGPGKATLRRRGGWGGGNKSRSDHFSPAP